MRIVVYIGALFFLLGCETNEEANGNVYETPVLDISCVEKTIVGQSIKVKVDFMGPDGCSSAYQLKADKVGQTISLRAYYLKKEGLCTMATVPLTLDYEFYPDLPGGYFFVSQSDNRISDTLTVY